VASTPTAWDTIFPAAGADAFHRTLNLKRQVSPIEVVKFENARERTSRHVLAAYCYRDVFGVLRDDKDFSTEIVPERYGPILGKKTVVGMQGPSHRTIRRAFAAALSPAEVSRMREETLIPTINGLIDRFDHRHRRADLVGEFAQLLPVSVTLQLLGISIAEAHRIRRCVSDALNFATNPLPAMRSARELRSIIRASRINGNDPLGGRLVRAVTSDGSEDIPEVDLVNHLLLLLVAGVETTTHALGTALACAFQLGAGRPAEFALDDKQRAQLVEESLRWESPIQATSRKAASDGLELAGHELPRGSVLIAHLGSANRDETVYPHADRIDPHNGRDTPHLAFGAGPHRCIGMHLARAEMDAAIATLMAGLPNIRPDVDASRLRVEGGLFRGVQQLPVSW